MKKIYLILIITFLFIVGCEKNQVLQYQVSAGIQMKFINTQAQREEWPDEFTANVFMTYTIWEREGEVTVEIEKELLIQKFADSLSVCYQAVENFEIPEITQEIWPRIDVTANINGVEWTGFADVQLFPEQTVSVGIELYITVPILFANFEAYPIEGDAPLTVQFTDLTIGNPFSWQWDFNYDGTIDDTLQSPEFTYDSVGVYTVSLTVSDGMNEDTEIKVDYINVTTSNQPPTPPSNPFPAHNASSVSIYTDLSWECTDPDGDSLTFDVYFGTSPNPPLLEQGWADTTYVLDELLPETPYYWKIVAHDDHSNSTTGNIWNFITGTTPEGMIFVQGGSFEMGDHYFEGDEDELPVHSVYLDSYYIGKFEVTQAEYEAVVGSNPSYFIGDDLPVDHVNWFSAVTFCNLKSQQEELTPCYNLDDWSCDFSANGYRLPTEAEWEYAARGGVNWTDDYRYSGCHEISDLPDYAWYSSNSSSQTHPVGTKLPNQIEIHDMSGNVFEWCWDWYSSTYYSSSPSSNPQGPTSGDRRVLIGGGWYYSDNNCRVANRGSGSPGNGLGNYGFRLVRTP